MSCRSYHTRVNRFHYVFLFTSFPYGFTCGTKSHSSEKTIQIRDKVRKDQTVVKLLKIVIRYVILKYIKSVWEYEKTLLIGCTFIYFIYVNMVDEKYDVFTR